MGHARAAAWSGLPRLAHADGVIPAPSAADGPVATWPTTDGRTLHGFRSGGVAWLLLDGVAGYRLDPDGVTAVAGSAALGVVEEAWLRSVLPLAIQERGTQVLHASAVRSTEGVVALCGVSGAGKSTLAAGLGARVPGVEVVADDALAFVVAGDGVIARPLPFRLRLRPESREALGLPEIAARADACPAEGPLDTLVLLDPVDGLGAIEAEPLDPADLVGLLMPHAYCFALEERKHELVEAYVALAATVPLAWRLSYPQRIERLDETIEALGALVL